MRERSLQALYTLSLLTLVVTVCGHAQEGSILSRLEQDLQRLIDKVKPSVVTVSAHRSATVTSMNESFFAPAKPEPMPFLDVINIGSGIVLDSIHILTYAGIIQNCDSIEITYSDAGHSRARLVVIDQETGLAVLQTHRSGRLRPAPLRLNERLSAGSTLALVGNSAGVSSAVSLGIVNGIREDGIIQVSTLVDAGNAGSPLFDHQGRLAAILAGRVSPVGEDYMLNEGFSVSAAALAYPAAEVIQRARQLIYNTKSEQGWIGVSAEDWPGGMGWVHISDVRLNSPAHQAGLQVGDIVFSSDRRSLKGSRFLAQLIRNSKPGRSISLGVLRGDSTFTVSLAVGRDAGQSGNHASFSDFTSVSSGKRSDSKPPTEIWPATMQQELLMQRINLLELELRELRTMLKNSRP